MAYQMATGLYSCDICDFEMTWDRNDDIHGSMWACEKCESHFCSKCFIDRHGADAFQRMLRERDKVLCPSRWEDAK